MMEEYLVKIGLPQEYIDFYRRREQQQQQQENIVASAFAKNYEGEPSWEALQKLYTYTVPKITEGVTCSRQGYEEKPFNLATEIYGLAFDEQTLKNHPQTVRLQRLNEIVKLLAERTQVDWLGIYRRIEYPQHNNSNAAYRIQTVETNSSGGASASTTTVPALVKEAYCGNYSRAIFPLTKEFAQHSNNSTVGMTGTARLVNSVASYSGPYYICDANVNSEFCIPIFRNNNNNNNCSSSSSGSNNGSSSSNRSAIHEDVIGIIDAEAFGDNHFTPERVLAVAEVSYELGKINMGL